MPAFDSSLRPSASRLARRTLVAFVQTFLLSRIVVLLIMTRRMPDVFLYVGQTHVHHLNYGIFLLVIVGAWLLFLPPSGRRLAVAASLFGVGLALTFDEFGMWLHLGGSYWQRASYDAVATVAGLLGLIVVAPALKNVRRKQWAYTGIIVAVAVVFVVLTADRLHRSASYFQDIERSGPQ